MTKMLESIIGLCIGDLVRATGWLVSKMVGLVWQNGQTMLCERDPVKDQNVPLM